jgi:hypothetical protein
MLPQDPAILLSVVNTKLRDQYRSLDVLCDDLGIDPADLADRLSAIGYLYDPATNQFR